MRNFYNRKGYALAGAMMFLLLVVIMWAGVTRQLGANMRVEKHLQSQKEYYDGCIRAISWGLTLLETGYPSTDPYSCRMLVGSDTPQEYVVVFDRTFKFGQNRWFTVTARPKTDADNSLPWAPSHF